MEPPGKRNKLFSGTANVVGYKLGRVWLPSLPTHGDNLFMNEKSVEENRAERWEKLPDMA